MSSDAPLFEWSTMELAMYADDPVDPDVAVLVGRELSRRERNRVAKRAGRPTTPPPEEMRVPVSKAVREFREEDVKRDASGRFSKTRGAKRPKPPINPTSDPNLWSIGYESSSGRHVIRAGDTGDIVTYVESQDGSPEKAIAYRRRAREEWGGAPARPKPPATLTEAQEPSTDDFMAALGHSPEATTPAASDDALDKTAPENPGIVLSAKDVKGVPVMFGSTERSWGSKWSGRTSFALGMAYGLELPAPASRLEKQERDGYTDVFVTDDGEEMLIARFATDEQAWYFINGAESSSQNNAIAYQGYKDWTVQPNEEGDGYQIVNGKTGDHIFYPETKGEAREFYNSFRDASAAFKQQRDVIDPPPAPEDTIPPSPLTAQEHELKRHEARIEEAEDAKRQAFEARDALRRSILDGTYDGEHAIEGGAIPGEQMMLPGFDAPEDFEEYRKLDAKARAAVNEVEQRKAKQQRLLNTLKRLEEDELEDFDLSDPENVELFAEKLFGMTTSTGFIISVSGASATGGEEVSVSGYVLKPGSYSDGQLEEMTLPQLETLARERGATAYPATSKKERKRGLVRAIAQSQRVGSWNRTISLEGDGDYQYPDGGFAYHDSFTIDGVYQGEGIMQEWFDQLFDGYRRLGLSHVRVHANITVGGYAWAAKGFDWEYAPQEFQPGEYGVLGDEMRSAIVDVDAYLYDNFKPDEETVESYSDFLNRHDIDPEPYVVDDENPTLEELQEAVEAHVAQAVYELENNPEDIEYSLSDDMLEVVNRALGQTQFLSSPSPWSLELIREVNELHSSVEYGELTAWEASQWLNESKYRWTEGKHTLWPGKYLLLGSDWNGYLYL